MGLDDDDEDDQEDEWRALLEKGWKKATDIAEGTETTEAATAEAVTAEPDLEDAAEGPGQANETEDAPEALVEVALEEGQEGVESGEAAAEESKPSALFGDFEISDEEADEDGTLEAEEAEEWVGEADEGEAAEQEAVEEPVAAVAAAAAPSAVAKAPVAKTPPAKAHVAKRPPLVKSAAVAKLQPGARPVVAKAAFPKVHPGTVRAAPVAPMRPPRPAGAWQPPAAFSQQRPLGRPPQPAGQMRPPQPAGQVRVLQWQTNAAAARPQQPVGQARPQQWQNSAGARPPQPAGQTRPPQWQHNAGARPQAARPSVPGGQPAARPPVVGQQAARPLPANGRWVKKGAGKGEAAVAGQHGTSGNHPIAGKAKKRRARKARARENLDGEEAPQRPGGPKISVPVKKAASPKAKAASWEGASSNGAASSSSSSISPADKKAAMMKRTEIQMEANRRALKLLKDRDPEEQQRKLPKVRKAVFDKLINREAETNPAILTVTDAIDKVKEGSFFSKVRQSNMQGKAAGKGAASKGKGKGWAKKNSWTEEGCENWDGSKGLKRKHSSKGEEAEKKVPVKFNDEPVDGDASSADTDMEGRRYRRSHIVVNLANVGASYAKKVLGKEPGQGRLFDWEGVRRCVRVLSKDKKLKVVGVIHENFMAPDNGGSRSVPMPVDIKKLFESVEETPRISGENHRSADDEMTIKCAYRRNCYFLDNDNYRDWNQQIRDAAIREWLNKVHDLLHKRYYFDSGLGVFELLDGNMPDYQLATGAQLDKTALWTAARDRSW